MQTRRSDNNCYSTLYTKEQADKAIDKYLKETDYKSTDILKSKGQTFGLCYGVYTELKDKDGNVITIKEKAKDFFGKTKLLKTITH